MNIESVKNLIVNKTARPLLVLRKFSPEILVGLGIVSLGGALFTAVKAGMKVDAVMEDTNDMLERIHAAKDAGKTEAGLDYSEEDFTKDVTLAYVKTGYVFAKLFGPSLILGGASVACFLGSHAIMSERNLAVMAAFAGLKETFANYRGRVVEKLGETEERLIRYNGEVGSVTEEFVDEDGKKKKKTTKVEIYNPDKSKSEYARFFDTSNRHWHQRADYNMIFLQTQQNYANDQLRAKGHLFLNEVYDALGLPHTSPGSVVGWLWDSEKGDNYVTFGLGTKLQLDDIFAPSGNSPAILLDFNIDGVIWDLI